MRSVKPWAVLLALPGCATHPIPESTFPPFGWEEWEAAPLTLLESIERFPVVYQIAVPNTHGTAATPGEPAVFAGPEPAPAPTTPPAEIAVPEEKVAIEYAKTGTTLKMAASAEGSPPLSFQWQKDGRTMAGANQALLTIEQVSPSDAGTYVCIVSNAAGSQASQAIRVIVRPP
jgi:hypothetical protein